MDDILEYLPNGMLVLKNPQRLPDVLDMLIVGGGPAGTSAALHAKELGLTALVIDYDDMMKRIRDYPKDKLILPDFGGGDQMQFPKGGALVAALQFPAMDKDEICKTWKQLYFEHSIPVRVGIEFLGLTRLPNGILEVKVWDHNSKCEQTYSAKHLVIAMGRGVPRRFDIPGNTDGIAYRLLDSASYVGEPALVLGGGTSGGEAVIAISHAKIKGNDSSSVYWSYRGAKLPKVSKALAEALFDAYLGNGNIRYLPDSEPIAITTAEDRKEYLSVRIDRKRMIGRPSETSQIEFPKTACIACIGEDIPEAFLNSIGVFMATGGPSNKKRMVVTPLLETQQENVYLIGDILSQAYLETNDFQGKPESFQEIKHRGNIKASLRDGVLVAKVISQKIVGKKEISIDLDFEDAASVLKVNEPLQRPVDVTVFINPPEKDKTKIMPIVPVAKEGKACIIRMLAGNVEETEYPLMKGGTATASGITTIGRQGSDIVFPDDPMLSQHHASIICQDGKYLLMDNHSETGVFLKATAGKQIEVFAGDIVQIGSQCLLFDAGFCVWYNTNGQESGRYKISEKAIILGRDSPDITLNKTDKSLSRRHVALSLKEGKSFIKDLESANGTYLKVMNRELAPNDIFRVGQQTFKLNLEEGNAPARHITMDITSVISRPSAPMSPAKALQSAVAQPAVSAPILVPASSPVSESGTGITFKNNGKCLPFRAGQTVCELAEKNGIKIIAECHAGVCGSDPVRILSGQGNTNPIGSKEQETLEDLCSLTAGEYRMACMLKPTGPIEVEIL
jgi:pSer/pThr/pTyr-binding forkhead associated (FHA) protein/thioredoxin reductase/ferredoxin